MLRVYGNRSKGSYDFDPAADEADKERGLLQAEGRGSYAPFESLTLTAGGELRWETLEGDQMINGSEDGESHIRAGGLVSFEMAQLCRQSSLRRL